MADWLKTRPYTSFVLYLKVFLKERFMFIFEYIKIFNCIYNNYIKTIIQYSTNVM